jgi:hypothetical protein
MKRFYWFVRNLNGFGPDDVVYKVAVGSSMRESAKLALVQEYVKDCGMYLKVVDDTSDKTISMLANSLFGGSSLSTLYLRRANVSISQLYDLIVDDSFVRFEASVSFSKTHALLLSLISPSSHWYQNQSHCNTTCQPYRRKYLSDAGSTEIQDVLVKAGFILALFALSGYLEHLERLTY